MVGVGELEPLCISERTMRYSYTTLLNLLTQISEKWGKGIVYPSQKLEEICNIVINNPVLKSNRRTSNALSKAIKHLKVNK